MRITGSSLMQNTTGGAAELRVLTALFSVNLAALGMLSGWHLAGQSRRAAKEKRLMNLTVIFIDNSMRIAIYDLYLLSLFQKLLFYKLVAFEYQHFFTCAQNGQCALIGENSSMVFFRNQSLAISFPPL